MIIRVQIAQLTTFETAVDGSEICLNMRDVEGRDVGIMIPIACLNSLMMTLPRMLNQAARRKHGDPNLRIVYPAAHQTVELGHDVVTRIVTLGTPDGFSVSFALSPDQCRAIGEAAETTRQPSARLN